jgi:hypothetical membrane protein
MTWSGIASSLVGFASTLLATVLSPSFSWTGSALSDLGTAGAATPGLFNGGLVVAGIVALPFAWVLFATARHVLEQLGAASFAGSVVGLALVGAFPIGTALHTPVAIAYFLLFTVAMWLHGSGAALAGDVRRGLVSIWLGMGHLLAWLGWAASGIEGIAIPEIVGSAILLAWIVRTTRWVRRSTG